MVLLDYDSARVFCNVKVDHWAQVFCRAKVYGNAKVCETAQVCDDSQVFGKARVDSEVCGNTVIKD